MRVEEWWRVKWVPIDFVLNVSGIKFERMNFAWRDDGMWEIVEKHRFCLWFRRAWFQILAPHECQPEINPFF